MKCLCESCHKMANCRKILIERRQVKTAHIELTIPIKKYLCYWCKNGINH